MSNQQPDKKNGYEFDLRTKCDRPTVKCQTFHPSGEKRFGFSLQFCRFGLARVFEGFNRGSDNSRILALWRGFAFLFHFHLPS